MADGSSDIKNLVADDRLEDALQRLSGLAVSGDVATEVVILRNRLRHSTTQRRRGEISADDSSRTRTQIARSVLELIAEAGALPVDTSSTLPVVFLSYSHSEQFVVLRLRDLLKAQQVKVLLDVDDLGPGERIAEFIRRSVKQADATVVVVSTAALSSGWVVLEVLTTLGMERFGDADKKLISCHTDDRFFKPEFRLQVTETIDARLETINRLIPDYLAKSLDLVDLTDERDRLLRMRGELGTVLERLKATFSLDLQGDALDEAAAKVASRVRQVAH